LKKIKKISRFWVFYISIFVFFAMCCVKLFSLQVISHKDIKSTVNSQLYLSAYDPAPRGDITDRNGTVLAGNRQGYIILVNKRDDESTHITVTNLAKITNTDLSQLKALMKEHQFSKNNPFIFSEDADFELVTKIKESPEKFPCIDILCQPVRKYFYPETAVHLIGRCGLISKEEYEKNPEYQKTDYIGKQGAEKAFESYLKGTAGSRATEKSVRGKVRTFTESVPPVKGKTVALTIDLPLQTKVEEALDNTVKSISGATGGAVVITDVNSGEVLALSSNPAYNIDEFNKNYTALSKNKNKPFFNRSISGLYEPGSTFKPIVAIAAMRCKNLLPEEKITTRGEYRYYDRVFRCNIFRQTGKSHGRINVSEALGVSCNYFFYELGHRTGIEEIAKCASDFMLGQPSGIELKTEEAIGKIASPHNRATHWYAGDTLQAAIGQSDNRFTPIALANYAAAIANGGSVYSAHVLKSVDGNETKPEILNTVYMENEALDEVRRGMLYVTKQGTAKEIFKDFPVDVAGKTGSAQVLKSTNGLFIGYAPYNNPKIAFCAVIEGGGSGNAAASTIKEILSFYFKKDKKGQTP